MARDENGGGRLFISRGAVDAKNGVIIFAKNAQVTSDRNTRVSAPKFMSPDSHPRPRIPDLVEAFGWAERFDLLDRIGAGAMGQVWLARERLTDKTVALKMLEPARVGDEQTLARLDIEAATLTKLREAGAHANVVPILDFKLTDSQACLVMEFIPGSNLKKWCEVHQLDFRARVKLIAQVARACGWFHGLGVVHRDLKPANILVHSTTQQPVIVDFSIAKVSDGLPLTLTNEALGTAPYMAPEQLDRSRGAITPATDVYALGATLYELLTQVHPHPGDLPQIIRRHADEVRPAPPSALNPEVPRDLECVCLKALSHRPGDRYADGTALAEDLERFLTGTPVKARPVSLVTRIVRRARQKPALTTAIAACISIGGVALWTLHRQQGEREAHRLESQLTTAMQHGEWTAASLEQAELTLASLASRQPAAAEKLRQLFLSDIQQDLEARLQQNHLQDSDFEWLQATTSWLEERRPVQASQLGNLIAERKGRWEPVIELRPPFDSLPPLLPSAAVRKDGDLLFPVYSSDSLDSVPALEIADTITVPMEMSASFDRADGDFHHIGLNLRNQKALAAVLLYRVDHTPRSVRQTIDLTDTDPLSYILFMTLDKGLRKAVHIPDLTLLNTPFRLTLKVERDRAEADLNGHWRVQIEVPFAISSSTQTHQCRISWPKEVGLKELILRTRRTDRVSPLESADLAAAEGKWAEALRLYNQVRGDPTYGPEADFKIAECLLRQENPSAAVAIWERLIQDPESPWRDRSLLQLWMHHTLQRELHHSSQRDREASLRYVDLLPDPLSPTMLRQIEPAQLADLKGVYIPFGVGLALPRQDAAEITVAARVFRLLQEHPVQTANRFAMAHHFARLDDEAHALFRLGLSTPAAPESLREDLVPATNCLDQWCRLVPSERESKLASTLKRWKEAGKDEATVQTIWWMEQARRAARAGDLDLALSHIQEIRSYQDTDSRVLTSALLLEGMLRHLQGSEAEALIAWRKALQTASTVAVTMRHPLHLFDCVLLHSLAQSWDLRSASDVLTTLAGRHLKGSERTAAQAKGSDRTTAQFAFNSVFLADPAWLTAFNSVLQDEPGRKLAEDYALCREPPRELVLALYHLLFERYFLSTAFPQATQPQRERVKSIVAQLVTEMAMNPRGEITHLYAYFRAWADPTAARTLFDQTYPYSPALLENLRWLLQHRHSS